METENKKEMKKMGVKKEVRKTPCKYCQVDIKCGLMTYHHTYTCLQYTPNKKYKKDDNIC